ncbi:programmed cell death protein 2-like [Trifolium pratense]|uniref:Programmed cell death protein 2-like n=1 Tax=Trifolium pratense TaxID=57577 RepID=A0A2K3LME4_TRIPR|nr:programmed cell death protein 2-like [Trifolium pratense]
MKAIRMDNGEFVDEDDHDSDEEEEEEFEPITFGFLEKPKNSLTLSRQIFPSKAGEDSHLINHLNYNCLCAWLEPLNIPSGKSSVCDFCGEPLQFLLQVYAPVVEKETTFHRMLFVFMCPSMTCLLRDQHEQWKRDPEKLCRSMKVFRCQLPRNNPFYSSECPKYDGSDKPYLLAVELLYVIGVVPGKETSSAVVANKCGIAPRNTRP